MHFMQGFFGFIADEQYSLYKKQRYPIPDLGMSHGWTKTMHDSGNLDFVERYERGMKAFERNKEAFERGMEAFSIMLPSFCYLSL